MGKFTRITQNAAVMGGKPCIRGMRVTVGMIVAQIGAGLTIDQLLADYPYLDRDDVLEALGYAAWRAQEREVALADSCVRRIPTAQTHAAAAACATGCSTKSYLMV
jgi:uncharacterized protein (DUF433 family)